MLLDSETRVMEMEEPKAGKDNSLIGIRILGFFALEFFERRERPSHRDRLDTAYKVVLDDILSCQRHSGTGLDDTGLAIQELGLVCRAHLMRGCSCCYPDEMIILTFTA